jgi:tRNA threonylcarbamoyl adenosine modification protein YjeE
LERWSRSKVLKQFYYLSSYEETILFGQQFGKKLPSESVVALIGDLGAGKTTLAKGIISSLCGIPISSITSPTFQYVQFYDEGVSHFDLWRLHNEEEFLNLGLEEYLAVGISLIEWPDRIRSLLPSDTLFVEMKVRGEGRELSIYK